MDCQIDKTFNLRKIHNCRHYLQHKLSLSVVIGLAEYHGKQEKNILENTSGNGIKTFLKLFFLSLNYIYKVIMNIKYP